MENKKPTQFLMKPKVDFCFKELMEDEEVRNAFLAAVLGINPKEINESKILPSHLRQKDKDDKLGILNFIMFDDEEYYSRFHFWSGSCIVINLRFIHWNFRSWQNMIIPRQSC